MKMRASILAVFFVVFAHIVMSAIEVPGSIHLGVLKSGVNVFNVASASRLCQITYVPNDDILTNNHARVMITAGDPFSDGKDLLKLSAVRNVVQKVTLSVLDGFSTNIVCQAVCDGDGIQQSSWHGNTFSCWFGFSSVKLPVVDRPFRIVLCVETTEEVSPDRAIGDVFAWVLPAHDSPATNITVMGTGGCLSNRESIEAMLRVLKTYDELAEAISLEAVFGCEVIDPGGTNAPSRALIQKKIYDLPLYLGFAANDTSSRMMEETDRLIRSKIRIQRMGVEVLYQRKYAEVVSGLSEQSFRQYMRTLALYRKEMYAVLADAVGGQLTERELMRMSLRMATEGEVDLPAETE